MTDRKHTARNAARKIFAFMTDTDIIAKNVEEREFVLMVYKDFIAQNVAEQAFALTGGGKQDAKIASSKRQPRTSAHSAGYKEMRTTSHLTWMERFPITAQPARR
jgi:hypothetical protein